MASSNNRYYCTAVEAMSANSKTISPFLILKAEHVIEK